MDDRDEDRIRNGQPAAPEETAPAELAEDRRWAMPRAEVSGAAHVPPGGGEGALAGREAENVPPQLSNGGSVLHSPKLQTQDVSGDLEQDSADFTPVSTLRQTLAESMPPVGRDFAESTVHDESFSKGSNSSGSAARGYRSGVPSPAIFDPTRAPSALEPSRNPFAVTP